MASTRVLLVEDHPDVRVALLSLLSREYTMLSTVHRGDEVLDAARRLGPDVVVLNVSLPGRSGLQVLPDLRRLLPNAVIVMMTAHDEPAYRTAALRLGADAFVSKSAGHGLLDTVRSAIAKRTQLIRSGI